MRFMVDFEKGLINSIKNNFTKATIDGCFFHYSKLLWNKARNLGLCKKDNLKITKILIFIFKLFPFILYDERIDIFKKIEEYYIDEKYKKFINYYKKNWLNNRYINYTELSNDEYVLRTNNYIERFHGLMNQSLDAVHPKISFLISKYEIFLKNIYNKITTSLVNKANEKEEKFSVINDILLFLSKYNKQYKTSLNFINIIQSTNELNEIIDKVTETCLEYIFDNMNISQEHEESKTEEIIIEDNVFKESNSENGNSNNDKVENEEFNFEEIFPKKHNYKKGKLSYSDAFGPDNELKIYLNNLKINENKDK